MINPTSIRYNKVAESMNCIACHNGSERGLIHSEFDANELLFKIVVDRTMPPNSDLTKDERLALYNCLLEEFNDPKVKESWTKKEQWLTRETCNDFTSTKYEKIKSSINTTEENR
jgi:hypothetical protein